MHFKDQAEADRLAEHVNSLAATFVVDPEAGRRAGYSPKATITTDRTLLSAGPGPHVQGDVFIADWIEAIARNDLSAWRWKIDRGITPAEIVIIDRR